MFTLPTIIALAALSAQALAQTGRSYPNPIRGVNLGSWFVVEPYMMGNYWDFPPPKGVMNCSDSPAEYECTVRLGQAAANAAFDSHWSSFISEADFTLMKSYGINTVRIPVGFWIVESSDVRNPTTDKYPQGGFKYLNQSIGWAANAGISVLIALHAVPEGATPNNAFAGRIVTEVPAPFWTKNVSATTFQRAANALANLTESAHTIKSWKTAVFAIEPLNEPPQNISQAPGYDVYLSLVNKTIREREKNLSVTVPINIAPMARSWQFSPKSSIPRFNPSNYISKPSLFDDHSYLNFNGDDGLPYFSKDGNNTAARHIDQACNGIPPKVVDNASNKSGPTLFGEFWLSNSSTCSDCNDVPNFTKKFGEAQRIGFLKTASSSAGWIFWSWKFRYTIQSRSYKDAVNANLINIMTTSNPNYTYPTICDKALSTFNNKRSLPFY